MSCRAQSGGKVQGPVYDENLDPLVVATRYYGQPEWKEQPTHVSTHLIRAPELTTRNQPFRCRCIAI